MPTPFISSAQRAPGRLPLLLSTLGALALLGCLAAGASVSAPAKTDAAQKRAANALVALPLLFEENAGQTDARVKFLSRGPGYAAFFTADETVLSLRAADSGKKSGPGLAQPERPSGEAAKKTTVLRTRLVGANRNPVTVGEQPLPAKVTYLKGNDPKRWRAAMQYQRVRARDVYPGIDLVHYGSQGGKLEYDFVVRPGADPSQIRFTVGGEKHAALDPGTGDLVLTTADGEVRQQKPVIYQQKNGKRVSVGGSFVLASSASEVSFTVAAYDQTLPLVIDPVLAYSTYLGGSGDDRAVSVATEGNGIAYVLGFTGSTNFPLLGQYQGDQSDSDTVLTKIDTKQTGAASLLYSTYLGGGGYDEPTGLAAEGNGIVYVAGFTDSTDFPVLGQYQGNQPNRDTFLTKLDTTQTGAASLLYSTYLGGNNSDFAYSVAAEGNGIVYVAGYIGSTDFPVLHQYQGDTDPGNYDGFLTKLDTTQTGAASLLYSTYLGGAGGDRPNSVAAEGNGIVYVAGDTSSTDFPALGQYQGYQGGGRDGFLTRLDTTQTGAASLLYSTYLGGSSLDGALSVAAEGNGIVYVAGYTNSTNFPTLGQFQQYQDNFDGFLTKMDTTQIGAASLLYSTYLGGYQGSGGSSDYAYSVAAEGGGTVYVVGYTASTNFPRLNQYQHYQGSFDAFLTKLDTTRTGTLSLRYSTYLGGSGDDRAVSVAAEGNGTVYVAGFTSSSNFPTLGQYQGYQGTPPDYDTFLTVFSSSPPQSPTSLTAAALSPAIIQLNWADNSGNETGFRLERKTGAGAFAHVTNTSANATSYLNNTGLAANTTYTYRVFAFNADGDSAASNEATVTTLLTGAPTALTAVGVNSSEIDLTWTDNCTGETGFEIWASTDNAPFGLLATGSADQGTYQHLGLSGSHSIRYKVRAVTGSNQTDFSALATGLVLAQPSGLDAKATGSTAIDVRWIDNATNETGYEVWRAVGGGGFTLLATKNAGATQHTDTVPAGNQTYAYQVRCKSGVHVSSYSSPDTSPAMLAPTNLVGSAITSTEVRLTWADNSANLETGFQVYRRTTAVGARTLVGTVGANVTSFTNFVLVGKQYWYDVRAVSGTDGSDYSNLVTTVTLAQPSGLDARALNSTQIDVRWTDNATNETNYEVWRATGDSAFTLVFTSPNPNATQYTDNVGAGNTLYTYMVRAKNGPSYSYFSNQDSTYALAAPSNLVATPVSFTRVDLTWTDNSGTLETNFQVYRRASAGGARVLVGTVGANVTSFSDLTVVTGTSYWYDVRAIAGNDVSSFSNLQSVTTP